MALILNTLVSLVAVLHLCFLVLEMFLWTTPKGLKIFAQSFEKAQASKVLAANQGLYNGFLSAGLIWSLLEVEPAFSKALKIFFLSCVFVAGLYGAYSVSRNILIVQAAPALMALILILFI